MSTLNRDGRYVLRSFFKGQQMNDPKWGWDDLGEICAYAEGLAADWNHSDYCEWAVFDRTEGREIARVRPVG